MFPPLQCLPYAAGLSAGLGGVDSPATFASTSAEPTSATPSRSTTVSTSPKLIHPASAATAGWVSSAMPITSGEKCLSA